jgi:aspartyl-tRNA(Asn)/glutamyl-tRNA(Gln) amidotransferase subunit A
MSGMDAASLSLADASRLIAKRELSPVELTEACLARIEAVDGTTNAFITVAGDEALAAAKAAQESIARHESIGPLHGIPIGAKDLFDTAGLRTTSGSKILADNVPDSDSGAVERLRTAGAVIIGKLNLHEFAFGATGVNPHYGSARNPWDTERITGGSSSGSGAAVAAGECPGALGTDTGGSIRIPASLCGITGLKPTFGRVSRRGVLPLSWALDHVGPMARTAEDCALMLQALAGADPLDASCSTEAVPDYAAALQGGVKGLRIGVPTEFFFHELDPEVEAAVRKAVETLRDLGAEIREVSLPLIAEAPAAVGAIMLPEALAFHQRWLAERPDDYGEDVRFRLENGATFTAVQYVQAQRFREMIVARWRDEVFDKVDLLATPTTMRAAPTIDEGDLRITFALIRNTNPLNLLGMPAISLPCGFVSFSAHPEEPRDSSEEGNARRLEGPIGLQLAGRWWDEETVLRTAHTYQQATDWHERRPELAAAQASA